MSKRSTLQRKQLSFHYNHDSGSVTIRLGFNFFAIAVGICLAIFFAELATRIWWRISNSTTISHKGHELYNDPREFWGGKNIQCPKRVYDTYLGYYDLPNSDGPNFHINSAGFRDSREISKKPDEDEIRVFFTGGSVAWGIGASSQEKSLGPELEKLLASVNPGKRVRVVNAAIPGYCITQERILLENRILDYHPDIVLMITGWNDINYSYMGVDTLEIQDMSTWRGKIDGYVRTSDGAIIPPIPVYGDFLFKTYYLFSRGLWKFRVGERWNHEWTYASKPLPLPMDRFEEIARRNLEIIRALARLKGIHVIVALQPIIYATNKPLSPYEQQIVQDDNPPGRAGIMKNYCQHLHDIMKTISNTEDMRFVSLLHVFDGQSAPIFGDEVHLPDRGYSILASYLAPLIESEINKVNYSQDKSLTDRFP